MADSLGYHIYHFRGNLPDQIKEKLHVSKDISFLKKPLGESIQTTSIKININREPSEKIDSSMMNNDVIVRRFFTDSVLEQIYIAVPVHNAFIMRDETATEFQQRIVKDSNQKLIDVFGVNYIESNFTLVSSLIIVLKDDKVFSDNKSYYESISQFVTHSYKIKSEHYSSIDNYQIVIDYEGVGIIFSSTVDLERVHRLIFILMLGKAYLATLEQISLGTVEPLNHNQNSYKEAEAIEHTLDMYNRFLIRYYYHNPIMVDVNKIFYVYERIKDVLKLRDQYNESKEQIRILSELSNTKNRQILDMRTVEQQEERQNERRFLEKIVGNINKISTIGFSVIIVELVLILLLFLIK
ncbi:MAG: hypothetical protein GKC53_06530 [Neisseriaceae bacterium]|nr:MAG: hypothetical protein GKC53_06530 [Neisseriaceae bacterium]